MAECFLQIGLGEDGFGDIFPLVFPMESLIPSTHTHLFHFMDYDLFLLEEPLKRYLSCLSDDSAPDKKLCAVIIRNLREMHPFFLLSPDNVQSFLNLTFADFIRRNFPESDLVAQREMLDKVAIKRYAIDSSAEEVIPELCQLPAKDHIVEDLFELQDRMRRLVFFTLDDSNESLAKLPTSRRLALYSLAYSEESLAYVIAEFGIQPSDKMRKYVLRHDFVELSDKEEMVQDGQKEGWGTSEEVLAEEEKNRLKVKQALDALYWKPDSPMSPALREMMLATDDVKDQSTITYEINSFSNLLDLEVYRMITEETHLHRCKTCHKYFIPAKSDQIECNECVASQSGDSGADKAAVVNSTSSAEAVSSAIPVSSPAASSKRTRQKKQQSQNPCYDSYRKRYKTLFARIASGKLTKENFEAWKAEALDKLDQVGAGTMAADDYEAWLAVTNP